jgi:hypothetical protein
LPDAFFQKFVRRLLGKNFQRAIKRQARLKERCELSRKNNHVLTPHAIEDVINAIDNAHRFGGINAQDIEIVARKKANSPVAAPRFNKADL